MRIALGIEYDGTAYNGWQRQKVGIGVQQRVEEALTQVADQKIETVCAGRTDTGVHAMAQVVHFDTQSERELRGWLLGTNSNLPDDINTTWVRSVSEDFHARFSALSRAYRYLILNRTVRSKLGGLPAGYTLRRGDMLHFDYGSGPTRRALHRIVEDATANGSGSTPFFEVRPYLKTGTATGAVVTLIKPAAKMMLEPGSFDPGTEARVHTAGMSFTAIEVR
jgi:tRNA pseudouridine(38-40) synthase